MKTITKKSVVNAVARNLGMLPKDVHLVIQEFLENVSSNLAEGNRFEFRNFGVFEVVTKKAKVGRNPKKPKTPIIIPERKGVKFTPGGKMKMALATKED